MVVEKADKGDIDELVELRIAYLTEDDGPLEAGVAESIKMGLPDYYLRHLGKDILAYVVRENGRIASCALLLVVEKPMSPAFVTGKTGTVLNGASGRRPGDGPLGGGAQGHRGRIPALPLGRI